jgi:hypothetical protein
MNKIYKAVWNGTKGAYVAVAETAKAKGKRTRSSAIGIAAAVGLLALVSNDASANTIASGTCNTGGSTLNGISYGAETNPVDGNGTWSTVAGCSASGGNHLAATAFGAFASVTGDAGAAFGFGATAAANATALGTQSFATGGNAVAVGMLSTASGYGAVAVGQAATSVGAAAIAVGMNATTSGNNSTSIGGDSKAGNHSVSIGNGADTSGADYGVAVGVNSSANGLWATAMGASAAASGDKSVSIGTNSTASGSQSTALGLQATASATNSVALGSGSTTTANLTAAGYNPGNSTLSGTASTANGEVSVGSAGKERRVTNVAAGSAATDAVNVSQLQSEDAKINADGTATAAALGGGASYDASTGKIKAPTYVVQSGTFSDVGSALTKLDGATTKNTGDISTLNTTVNNITNGTAGLVQQNATTHAITVASATAGTTVDFTGTAGTRQLKGVSAGTANTDAVNVAQLKAAGLNVDTSGNATNAFVAYDDTSKGKVTLGGGASGTTITDVKAGALSASSMS